MKKPTTRRRYTQAFKQQAVDLLQTGKSLQQIAQELEISPALLSSWKRAFQGRDFQDEGAHANGGRDVAADIATLKRQMKQLQLENAILKKAAIILGTQPASCPQK